MRPLPVSPAPAPPVSPQAAWRALLARLPRPVRRVLRPRSLALWALTAVAAIVTGTTVRATLARAEADGVAARPRPALVVTAPIAAGEALTDANTAIRTRPAGDLPEDALAERPVDASASIDLVPGEVVLTARLAPAGLSPAAALLPAGYRGLAVPQTEGGLPVTPGDRVDVVALGSLDLAADPGAARAGAAGASVHTGVVVAVGEEAVVVGVPAGEVPALAAALADGRVQLALRGVDP